MLEPWPAAIALVTCALKPPRLRWPPERVRVVRCPDPPHPLDDWLPPDEQRANPQTQVLEVLAEGPKTPSAIAKALQCGLSTVSMRLSRMESRGLVHRRAGGTWVAQSA